MKTIALAVLFTIFVVVAEGKSCRSTGDCDATECCLARGIFGRGECTPRAQKDETCSEDDDLTFGNKYRGHCPCASGLTCEPEEVKKFGIIEIRINERCVGGDTTTSEPEPEPETEEPEPEPETEEPEETPAPEEEAEE